MFNYFKKDVGLDLGTANSLLYIKEKGIMADEPSVVAINNKTGQIVAIGHEAKKMIGRTPAHISVIKPLINGVISDFEMTQELIRYFLKKTNSRGVFNYYRAVIGIPPNLTEVERKSVEDAVITAGATKAYLIEEPLAAALGARLPIEEASATMLVDIGGGTTDIAVISMNGTVISKSLKIAGDKFNDDIVKFMRDEFKLVIGEPTAEEVKKAVGSAIPLDEKLEIAVRGREMTTGLPKEIILKNTQVRAAISKSLRLVTDSIKEIIEKTPPELVGDILEKGIFLCGGGSLLRGLDELIEKEIAVSVTVVDDPLTAVVRGTGIIAENIDNYSHLFTLPLKPLDIN